MKNSEFFNMWLPKWPALLVVGKPITSEQAKEIIIRTDYLGFSSNDREFDAKLNSYFYEYDIHSVEPGYNSAEKAIRQKLGLAENDWTSLYEYQNLKKREVGQLNLEYLNNSRIVSSWVGGPHGWCDWSGNIGTHNYNIGKHPSVEEVYNEWKLIAKAFPFLELTSQLMSKECGEDGGIPVVEYKVKNGKVRMVVPKSTISESTFGTKDMYTNLFTSNRERGCTIAQFKDAVDFVRHKQIAEVY